MLFLPAMAMFFGASSVFAAPSSVVVEDRGLLGGLLGGGSAPSASSATAGLQGLTSSLLPIVTGLVSTIESTVKVNDLTNLLNVNGTTSTADLTSTVAGLTGVLSGDQISTITNALDSIPLVGQPVHQLLQTVLDLVKQLGLANIASGKLASGASPSASGGLGGLLGGLLGGGGGKTPSAADLQNIITQVLSGLSALPLGLSGNGASSGLGALTTILDTLKSGTDTNLSGLLGNANSIVPGLLSTVTGLLGGNGLLGGLLSGLGLGSGAGGLSSLLSGLGLNSLTSILGL